MNLEHDWRTLTLGQFVDRYCEKPLSKGLRAVVNDERRSNAPYKSMSQLRSEADVRRIRRVGLQSGAAIIATLQSLGWEPQPDRKEINDLCHSALLQLGSVATRLRRFAKANAGLSKRISRIQRRVSRAAEELESLRSEWCRTSE